LKKDKKKIAALRKYIHRPPTIYDLYEKVLRENEKERKEIRQEILDTLGEAVEGDVQVRIDVDEAKIDKPKAKVKSEEQQAAIESELDKQTKTLKKNTQNIIKDNLLKLRLFPLHQVTVSNH